MSMMTVLEASNMDLHFHRFSDRYTVRRLTDADLDVLYALCKGNRLYYQHMKQQPTPENLRDVFTALPDGKRMVDKYFLGFFEDGKLVALLDLITQYPDQETAFIGWFMLDIDYQGTGRATALLNEILSALKTESFRHVRLGYIQGNPQSERFWYKNGFNPTGTRSATDAYTVVHMQREIG